MGISKKYTNNLCVYCRERQSSSEDHVFPKGFFQIEHRHGLPKVPSCVKCNNDKSKLEHYLASILPFGATHENAEEVLSKDVTRRLNKNLKLKKQLRNSMSRDSDGNLSITFDHKKFEKWIEYVGLGLMCHHWDKYLTLKQTYKVVNSFKSDIFTQLFTLSSDTHIQKELGDGIVRYRGMMLEDKFYIWIIEMMDGMTFTGKDKSNVSKNSFVTFIAGNKSTIDDLS